MRFQVFLADLCTVDYALNAVWEGLILFDGGELNCLLVSCLSQIHDLFLHVFADQQIQVLDIAH